MAYLDDKENSSTGHFNYRVVEISMPPRVSGGGEKLRFLTVDSDQDTLRYVEEHMEDFVANVCKMTRLEAHAGHLSPSSAAPLRTRVLRRELA